MVIGIRRAQRIRQIEGKAAQGARFETKQKNSTTARKKPDFSSVAPRPGPNAKWERRGKETMEIKTENRQTQEGRILENSLKYKEAN